MRNVVRNMNETIRAILMILLLFGLYLVFERFREKRRLKSLREQRPGLSKADYIRHFESQGFRKTEIETLHDRLKEFLSENDFQLNPEDDFHEDYKIVDLDDVELIDQVCDTLKLPHPTQEDYDSLNNEFQNLNARSTLTLIEKIKEKNTAYNKK